MSCMMSPGEARPAASTMLLQVAQRDLVDRSKQADSHNKISFL